MDCRVRLLLGLWDFGTTFMVAFFLYIHELHLYRCPMILRLLFLLERDLFLKFSSSVGKLDQAGIPASACTGLYQQKGKINPGDTGSQPKHLHIRRDIKTTNKHLLVLDQMVFLYIF
jgi:hypothetical protein